MEVSDEILEIVEKIRDYRIDKEIMETLKSENELLAKQNIEFKKALTNLHSELIDQNELLEKIKNLTVENRELKLDKESYDNKFDFVVTTPNLTNTVYGEIRTSLAEAKKEVLVCSPWITYLFDEFKGFNKDVKMKIITTFREEDIHKGITDKDKLNALINRGAEVRYNNNLHAKMIFVDSKTAIISSANLTKNSLSVNYEAGMVIRDKDYVKKALEFFNGVWKESKPLSFDK